MKHLKKIRKFSRKKDQREAMLKTMLGSFITKGRITTTEAKAKELKRISDRIISRFKQVVATDEKGSKLAVVRYLTAQLPKNVGMEQIKSIAGRFSKRESGFSRVIKKGARRSDSAKMAILEMLSE
ncbi:MAG: 50S ribosomal protein L17 [Parcubacteria group bacterium]|jgi:large subunit ribosomal protein L17